VPSRPYDAFISYRRREPDRQWVHDRLVVALRSRGLRICLDDDDFRLGQPVVLEMERAVEQSRYTVAVLTPEWVMSSYTEFEEVLARTLGLETGAWPVIAVVRRPTPLPLRLRAVTALDMSDDATFEPDLDRLCAALRRTHDE
jgi:hypothetical protein